MYTEKPSLSICVQRSQKTENIVCKEVQRQRTTKKTGVGGYPLFFIYNFSPFRGL